MNIRDIATRSGVSVATVSRVINNNSNVSAKTRERVQRVMLDEGYTPNAFARGLGLNSMKMVGIVVNDIANPFYSRAVSLLERELRLRGFDTLLCCSGNALQEKQKCIKLLLLKRVDAIVLTGATFCERTNNGHIASAAKTVPVFLINALLDIPELYCVLCDERQAMRDATISLANVSREILYLHDMTGWAWAGTRKLEGHVEGLNSSGIKENPALIQAVESSVKSAERRTCELLDGGVQFSSVLASEDMLAVGALRALISRGLNMPIIGFNNSLLCECTTPQLTSVDNMLDSLCPTAVELLSRLLGGEHIPRAVTVTASLIQRDTFRQ